MASLPPLPDILSSPGSPDSPLAAALSTLFEPSAVLLDKLVPALALAPPAAVPSYTALVDLAIAHIAAWDPPAKAALIAAHPRIGAAAALSALSRTEQAPPAAAAATAPAVLARLAQLNARYEARFPGLRYVTFVDGRSRAAVADALAAALGPPGDAAPAPVAVGGPAWLAELDRAVGDVAKIAKSRLRALGVA